jgi:hypothetical protein
MSASEPATIHLANSHRWLYEQLTELAEPDPDLRLVERRQDADVIVYPVPPWPDAEAPEPLKRLRPRELARCFVFSQADEPFTWAPGMYASLPRSRARPGATGGFYVAPNHRGADRLTDELEAARGLEPDLLWSFMGTGSNAPVRQRLLELDDPEALVRDTQRFSDEVRWRPAGDSDRRAAHAEYAQAIGRSTFVVCPRGRGPGSMRLFEAMQAGRCPVILADDWLPPPFVDWEQCTLRVPETCVHELSALLHAHAGEARDLGRVARRVWEERFSPERQLTTLCRAALDRRERLPGRLADLALATLGPQGHRRAYREAKRAVATTRAWASR